MIFSANVENGACSLPEIQRAILSASADGEGFMALLALAHRVLRSCVTLCSTSLFPIASYPEDEESFFFDRSGQSGGMLLPRREAMLDFFHSGIPQRILDYPDEPFLARYHDTALVHLFCGVRVEKALAAYLCVVWNRDDLPEEIADFVVFFSKVLSLEMQKSRLTSAPFFNRELLLVELLNGQHEQLELTLEQFPELLEGPPHAYRLCAVHAAESGQAAHLTAFRGQLLKLYPDAICHAREAALYMLVRQLCTAEGEEAGLRLRGLLRAYRFHMVCSNPIRALARLPEYLRQVDSLRGTAWTDEIVLFERALPACAFGEAYPNALTEEWLHPHIRLFMAHDALHQTDYIASLAAYLRCGRNMQAAANALFIHKTSLLYRFSKMQDISAPFLHDAELLFLYEYSLRILKLI